MEKQKPELPAWLQRTINLVLVSGADKAVVEDRASGLFVEIQNFVSGWSWP